MGIRGHCYGSETGENGSAGGGAYQPAQEAAPVHAGFRQALARLRKQLVHGFSSHALHALRL